MTAKLLDKASDIQITGENQSFADRCSHIAGDRYSHLIQQEPSPQRTSRDEFLFSPSPGHVGLVRTRSPSTAQTVRVSMHPAEHGVAAKLTQSHNADCTALAFRVKEIGKELWHRWVAETELAGTHKQTKTAAALQNHVRDATADARSVLALELHRLVSKLRHLAFNVCQCPQPCYTTDSVCKVVCKFPDLKARLPTEVTQTSSRFWSLLFALPLLSEQQHQISCCLILCIQCCLRLIDWFQEV